jgi:mRNA interferase MazF
MVKRSEIYWLQLAEGIGSEQAGRRPVLIVQNDVGNRSSPTTVVAAITPAALLRRYPFHVPFAAQESGLQAEGTVLCEQIQTVDQSRLGALAGALSRETMREVDVALHHSLGLEH